ncbi:succinate dehydrogenase assembly factor 2 [Halomonas binhaiensis]|uniref:FAD assembly factor SdhE n=1 Tax=Halomonas binhaiensis TaxID=2562282 RepID=UPI003B83303E
MEQQSSPVASSAEAERKRLHWHSRRGMWELDLLLLPFLEHRYDDLSEDDKAAYRALITEEDQDLFVWLMRREWPEEPVKRRIVQMIVDYAENSSNGHNRGL